MIRLLRAAPFSNAPLAIRATRYRILLCNSPLITACSSVRLRVHSEARCLPFPGSYWPVF